MTDIEKIIDSPAPQVEVVTDTAGNVAKSAEEQTKDEAQQAFDASQAVRKPVVADASVSAADGSTNSVAGG